MNKKVTKEKATKIEESESNHWQLIRKVIGFQFKLVLDGLRDVLLSPISIGAAVLGLLTRPDDPEKYFRELLKFGIKSDKWINLFDSPEHMDEKLSSDSYISQMEDLVIKEVNKGGVLKSVKDQTDSLIDKAQSRLEKKANNPKNDN